MARPTTKEDLVATTEKNFALLWRLIEAMPGEALEAEFDFSSDVKKKEAHWARDKNIRDVLVHLYEWHQLLLAWIKANMAGDRSAFLPAAYTWKTYGEMNMEFWRRHQGTDLEDAKQMVIASHKEVLGMVQTFSDEALFTKRYFDWTGTTSVGSYCVSAMSSHYDWAAKKLRAHARKFPRNKSGR